MLFLRWTDIKLIPKAEGIELAGKWHSTLFNSSSRES